MNSAESSLYTVAVTLCVFAAGILRGRTTRDWTLRWLTWFLTLEAIAFTLELLMVHPAVPLKGLWLGLRLGSSLLISPCLWLAVREIVEGVRPRLADLDRGHLIAIGAGFVLTIPLIADANLGVSYGDPQHPIGWWHARLIHTTMLGCIGIFAVQAPLFLWRCRALVLRHTLAQGKPARWLRLPLMAVATTWALGLLRTLQCATHAPKELALLFALADAGVAVGAVYLLVRHIPLEQPEAPAVAASPPVPARMEIPAARVPREKYSRSTLNAATRERIRRKVEQALATESVYTDSLLNLRSLSRAINEKAHYVSQVINQDMDTNFYELVSRQRIKGAKQMLAGTDNQSVLEIALAVGFNSKSTFNAAFRRHTGMTPRDFRAQRKG